MIAAAVFAASTIHAYTDNGQGWIAHAKITQIRQNGDNVYFEIQPNDPNTAPVGFIVPAGVGQKGALGILLTAASANNLIAFWKNGGSMSGLPTVDNVSLMVP